MANDLTKKAALALAVKRWGKTAAIRREQRLAGGMWHTVGRIALGMFFEVQGQGTSWCAAFADADEKDRQDAERAKEIASANRERDLCNAEFNTFGHRCMRAKKHTGSHSILNESAFARRAQRSAP